MPLAYVDFLIKYEYIFDTFRSTTPPKQSFSFLSPTRLQTHNHAFDKMS